MNLNVIYGDKEFTKRKLEVLLESAIDFYKPIFKEDSEKILLNILNKTYFCELDREYITKEFISRFMSDIDNFSLFVKGCCLRVKNVDIIITTNSGTNEDYHIFAHEFFGHRVCREFSKYVVIGNEIYNRDGISLFSNEKEKYALINEGFMELIASDIMKHNKGNITDCKSLLYLRANYCSEIITKHLGYEKMLQILVYNKYNLSDEYNSTCRNELDKLDNLLNLDLQTRTFKILNKYMNKKIDKNLEKFQKRKIR